MLADVSGNLYADYSVIFDSSGTFHGDGSGLYDLPSPFDQSLNTTDNVTFGSIVAQTFSGDGGPLTFANPPASATAPGTVGQIAQDGTYLYLCTAPNTWVRVLISSLFSTW